MTNSEDICHLLSEKYKKLYNSIPSCEHSLRELKQHLNDKIMRENVSDYVFDAEMVSAGIKKLKANKHDGDIGLWSNHLLMAPSALHGVLCDLFNAMMIHGYMPHKLLVGTVISIIKDNNGDLCSSDNLRGIALSSCIGKLFDLLLLHRYAEYFRTSDLQFSYKPNHSTTLCTLTLKEVVAYFKRNGSSVFCALVDASKAFDKVRIDKIAQLLAKRDLPAPVTRMIMDNLTRQQIQVYWAGHQSSAFNCTNGLRQGGVASPILFSVYFDELLNRLQNSGAGCYVGHVFTGAVAYADDVTLMAPTLQGLNILLKVCEQFADEYCVTFNSKKTVCIAFGQSETFTSREIKLHSETLQWHSEVKHLGNILAHNLKDDTDIRMKSNDLTKRVNGIVVNFRKVPREVCNKLFMSNCHFYGSQMWDLQKTRSIEKFNVTWRKCVRRLWNLPQCSRTYLLHHLINTPPPLIQLRKRFMNLFRSVQLGDNLVVKHLTNVSMKEPKGIIGNNFAICQTERQIPEDGAANAAMLIELTKCLEGSMNLPNFTFNEIQTFINYIATS